MQRAESFFSFGNLENKVAAGASICRKVARSGVGDWTAPNMLSCAFLSSIQRLEDDLPSNKCTERIKGVMVENEEPHRVMKSLIRPQSLLVKKICRK
jgi:hypothetical protein